MKKLNKANVGTCSYDKIEDHPDYDWTGPYDEPEPDPHIEPDYDPNVDEEDL